MCHDALCAFGRSQVLKLFQTGDGRRMMEVRFFHRLENTAITEKHGSGKKKDDDDGDEEDEEEEEDSQRDKIDAAREKEASGRGRAHCGAVSYARLPSSTPSPVVA